MKLRDLFKLSAFPVFVASLCCLSPVILVSLGIASISFGSSLADTFYGTYKWWFRLAGFTSLTVSIVYYLRRQKGICTIDDLKRQRNEILNIVALAITVSMIGYILFLYGVVHYIGALMGLWAL